MSDKNLSELLKAVETNLKRMCDPNHPVYRIVIERDGATVAIDPVSADFVKGSEIDFVDELIGAQFKIHNPNATASCGCGTSFSI